MGPMAILGRTKSWPARSAPPGGTSFYRNPTPKEVAAIYDTRLNQLAPWTHAYGFGRQLTVQSFWEELAVAMREVGESSDTDSVRELSQALAERRDMTPSLAEAAQFLRMNGSDPRRLKSALDALPVIVSFLKDHPGSRGGEALREIWAGYSTRASDSPERQRGRGAMPSAYGDLSLRELLSDFAGLCGRLGGEELARMGQAAGGIFAGRDREQNIEILDRAFDAERSLLNRFWILSSAFHSVVDFMTAAVRDH